MDEAAARRTIDAVWKMESARVIAGVARSLGGDVGLAEESAQDALVVALEEWPRTGIPENPGAWLVTAARRRAIDVLRRGKRLARAKSDLAQFASEEPDGLGAVDRALDGEVEDSVLRLVFTACHPAIAAEARTALALRVLCGLTTDEIARAFLAPEPTIAQRIVRAKRTLAEKQIPFEVPSGRELPERLASVLEVIYLLFNEGYSATAGDDWMRPALCEEAIRLGRIVAGLMPAVAEAHGLVALMELQASRSRARVDSLGKPVLLLEQDRTKWDGLLIRRGLAALETALKLGTPGPYALQGAIAACHARARVASETDWRAIAAIYGKLVEVTPSPVIELNRAVAVSMAEGPEAGLAILDGLRDEPSLREYHLLPAARGDFLDRLGRKAEARAEFERAAGRTRNAREREVLLQRAGGQGRGQG